MNINITTPQPNHIDELRALWKEAFGDADTFLDIFFSVAFAPERCRCLISDNHVVAALYWFNCEYMGKSIAYIYAVATAKAYHGRGFCRRLLENTHTHLAQLGYEGALLVPGSQSLFSFYEKLGYRTSCYHHVYQYTIDGNSAFTYDDCPISLSIQEIDAWEYARLRKKYLPVGSVIQEKENLSFLQTQLQFYSGNDFLLAAHNDKDILHGIEFLGNQACIPSLLHNPGYKKGIFCTPGQETPFAMYYSFGKLTPPTYFGFAFNS